MLITRAAMRPGFVALSVLRLAGASAALVEALVEAVLAPGWVTAVWAADAAGAADVTGAATGAGAADLACAGETDVAGAGGEADVVDADVLGGAAGWLRAA